jgi:hypothetical protein
MSTGGPDHGPVDDLIFHGRRQVIEIGHPGSLAGKTSSEQEAFVRPIVSSMRKSKQRRSS